MISKLDEPATVLSKLRSVRAELANGVYDPVQVVSASYSFEVLLALLNSKPRRRVTRAALYETLGVSRTVASNVVTLKGSPKMENFFLIVDSLITSYENELGVSSISIDAMQGVPAHYVSVSGPSAKGLPALVELLADLVEKVRGSNSASAGLLNEFERRQLILVLEIALNGLKSPKVEVSFLEKLRGWLQKVANKSAKKGSEAFIGGLANNAAVELAKFLKGLL